MFAIHVLCIIFFNQNFFVFFAIDNVNKIKMLVRKMNEDEFYDS